MKLRSVFGMAALGLILFGAPELKPMHAQEIVKQHIYSETTDPRKDIAAALREARKEHKRVLLSFGGDWCPDCQMLNVFLHDATNAPIVDKDFVVVHVWIGHKDRNLDLAQQYGVPIDKGVPAMAVLDAHGKVIHAQTTGEFKDMRGMASGDVTEFLNRWKA
jgi:thiol:disulfide interchange protein